MFSRWKHNFLILAGLHGQSSRNDHLRVRPQARPVRGWQHENCQLPTCKILLVAKVLIGSYQEIVLRLGFAKQFAVGEPVPTDFVDSGNLVTGEFGP